MQVQSLGGSPLGWEDPLGEGTASLSSILAWRIPWTGCAPSGPTESNMTEVT